MDFPKSSRRVRVPYGVIPLLALVFCSMVSARADTPGSGTSVINGKPVELEYAKAIKREPVDNKEATVVVLTEKDPSKSKNQEHDTMFAKLGGGSFLPSTSGL